MSQLNSFFSPARLQPFHLSHLTGPVQDQEAKLDGYCLSYQQVDCENGLGPTPAYENTAPSSDLTGTIAGTRDEAGVIV